MFFFFQDSLHAFVSKLHNWSRKPILQTSLFEKLRGVTDESQIQLGQFLNYYINEHLQSLEKGVERYFPELSQEMTHCVLNLMYPVSHMISKMNFWI